MKNLKRRIILKSNVIFKNLLILLAFLILSGCARSQKKIRIMTYNLENYCEDGDNEDYRNDDFRLIVDETSPDIIIAQEIWGAFDGSQKFLNDVLNYKDQVYAAGFIDQVPDWDPNKDIWQDIGVYYKAQDFRLLSIKEIEIAGGYLRDAVEFKLEYQPINDTLTIFGVHLDAGTEDAESRYNSAKKLRKYCNNLPDNEHFIIAGDFNIYKSSEKAWQEFTETQTDNSGRVFDPINRIGNWHENTDFKDVHTQATRKNYGGLDDRFDFILISGTIKNNNKINYVNNSYTNFGNDGNQFNGSINTGENEAVSDSVADALFTASDHLPVYADFQISNSNNILSDRKKPGDFTLQPNYPNPFNSGTNIHYYLARSALVKINIYNVCGQLVKSFSRTHSHKGHKIIHWNGKDKMNQSLESGVYFYQLITGNISTKTRKMLLFK